MNDLTEMTITRALVAHLAARGFEPVRIMDDEASPGENDVATADDIIRYCRAVDLFYYDIVFRDTAARERYWLTLIPGNGEDVVSDWCEPSNDPHGWAAAMDAFDASTVGELGPAPDVVLPDLDAPLPGEDVQP